MFTSRPFSHVSRAECGGTPEALGAREIIGDAILRFVHQQPTILVRSRHYAMNNFTFPRFGAMSLSDRFQRAARPSTPLDVHGGDVCHHDSSIAQRADLRAKRMGWDAREYSGISELGSELGATSWIALGNRPESRMFGAGPDSGRRTP